jgi:phage terminase large subunit-like protein
MTGGRSGLVERAIEQLEGAVRNRDITHDGSHTLTRHVLNARRRLSHSKLALAKENDYSSNKIDAAVAAVLAYQARLDALSRVVTQPSTFYVPQQLY